MKILALDISTKNIGWAVMEAGKITASGCERAKDSDELLLRLAFLSEKMEGVLHQIGFTEQIWDERIQGYTKKGKPVMRRFPTLLAYIEDGFVKVGKGATTAITLGKARYAVEQHLSEAGIPITYIKPTSWKAAALGSGRITKEETMAYYADLSKTGTEDEADAIGLAYAAWNIKEVA